MGSVPVTIDPALTASDKLVNAGTSILQATLVAAAKTNVPALNWPIISSLFNAFVGWLVNLPAPAERDALAHAIIESTRGAEGQAAIDAKAVVVAAETTGDPSDIAKANSDFDTAFGNLIHSDGS